MIALTLCNKFIDTFPTRFKGMQNYELLYEHFKPGTPIAGRFAPGFLNRFGLLVGMFVYVSVCLCVSPMAITN